jgi:hypothetical protein
MKSRLSSLVSLSYVLCFLVLNIILVSFVHGWRQWLFETQWSQDTSKITNLQNAYYDIWGDVSPGSVNERDPAGYSAPRPRTGHSMVLTKLKDGFTYILMFGGRDNNKLVSHVPKTYNIKKVHLYFVSSVVLY